MKYLEPVPFEKYTPAVARTAKPKNPTKPKSRLAHNEPIDDEIGVPAETKKGNNMTNEIDRGPYYKMLNRQALARQAQTGESYAAAFKALGNKAEPLGDQNPKRNAEHCPNDDVKQNRPPIML
jgi:hypothetical protein